MRVDVVVTGNERDALRRQAALFEDLGQHLVLLGHAVFGQVAGNEHVLDLHELGAP